MLTILYNVIVSPLSLLHAWFVRRKRLDRYAYASCLNPQMSFVAVLNVFDSSIVFLFR